MTSLLAVALAALVAMQGSLLEIRVLEGEGSVNAAGTRGPGLTLQVTDELGTPVSGAVISVRLPDQGPSGVFSSGLASEILTTSSDGRAATSPIRWNRIAGPVQIRITVMKDRQRAGTVVAASVSETVAARHNAAARSQSPVVARAKPRSRWLLVGLIAGGAAGVGFATGLATRGSHSTPAPAAAVTAPSVQVGPPVITITPP